MCLYFLAKTNLEHEQTERKLRPERTACKSASVPLKHLTCVARDPAPRRHHGQQPFEHDSFDVPESGAVPYSQRLEEQQVQAVGRDGHTVVEEHEGETHHRLEENPAQFAGTIHQLCHSETHRLQTNKAAVGDSCCLTYNKKCSAYRQKMCTKTMDRNKRL